MERRMGCRIVALSLRRACVERFVTLRRCAFRSGLPWAAALPGLVVPNNPENPEPRSGFAWSVRHGPILKHRPVFVDVVRAT